jgi:hypothetical protein
VSWHGRCSKERVAARLKKRVWLSRAIAFAAIAWCVVDASAAHGQPALPADTRQVAADCREVAAESDDPGETRDDADVGRRRANDEARRHYTRGELGAALDIWNQAAAPTVRCVNVEGLVRTRRTAIIEYLGTRSGEVLTAEALARVNRRVGELTFASGTPVRFDPEPGGTTTVTPIVTERGMLPVGLFGWGPVALRAAFLQDVRVRIVSPSGNGEVWTPSFRWSPNRPRAMLRFDAPAPGRLPGMVGALAMVERQTYRFDALGGEFRETRYRAGGSLSDWVTSWLRWEGGAAFDRIGAASRLALEGSLNARAAGDRLAIVASAGRWLGADAQRSFTSGELVASLRSTARQEVPAVLAVAGIAAVTGAAPLALWPAASTSEGRGAFLRAHPLRRNSVVNGEAFGRTLLFATTEYQHPIPTRYGTASLVGFVDGARAARRVDGTTSPLHVDVGAGVRVGALGADPLRFEVGYGLRDRQVRLSAGYVATWGRR